MQKTLGLSYAGSISALAVAACCVLPLALMLLGLGGSWLAVFGLVASTSYYVLAVSTALIAVAWISAFMRGSASKMKWWLGGTTVLTALAWVIVFNETRINDYLIMLM